MIGGFKLGFPNFLLSSVEIPMNRCSASFFFFEEKLWGKSKERFSNWFDLSILPCSL